MKKILFSSYNYALELIAYRHQKSKLELQNSTIYLKRGGALDACRFLASVFIIMYHFEANAPVSLKLMFDIAGRGHLATNFFIALSGFIIGSIYGEKIINGSISPIQFFCKRFIRIYPAHLIALIILVIIVIGAHSIGYQFSGANNFKWSELPQHLFLLHAFGLSDFGWNYPTWTLSTLLVCYMLFPWLWKCVNVLAAPLVITMFAIIWVWSGDLLSYELLNTSLFKLPPAYAIFRTISVFVFGLLLAKFVISIQNKHKVRRMFLHISGLVVLTFVIIYSTGALTMLSIGTAIVLFSFTQSQRGSRLVEFLARISFAMFLTHVSVGAVWFKSLSLFYRDYKLALEIQWLLWCLGIVMAIIVAALFHLYLEIPINKYIARRINLVKC
ncbi:MAG: acyltransferase [Verrucomicrobiota bacterium]|nr:acyltransferase [Verrucomicrobiota bacterium]